MNEALPKRSSRISVGSRHQTSHFITLWKVLLNLCSRCGETQKNPLVVGGRRVVIKNLPRSLELCLPQKRRAGRWVGMCEQCKWAVWLTWVPKSLSRHSRFGFVWLCHSHFCWNSMSLACVINITTTTTIYYKPQLNRYTFCQTPWGSNWYYLHFCRWKAWHTERAHDLPKVTGL